MQTGISVYFSDGIEHNERLIKRAQAAGAKYAFTSMHIPEEQGVDYERDARHILGLMHEGGISLIVDVGPETYEKLGCDSIDELYDLGITHVRLDYGFSVEETVRLSHTFHIVFNASTVTKAEISAWRAAGADFSRFAACHNFYPKQHTGLALEDVRHINDRLSAYGFEVIGFVPGDADLRGPLHEGLPMIEGHRYRRGDLALNMLEAAYGTGCDIVLVGDPGLTDGSWERLRQLSAGYVDLKASLSEPYGYLYEQAHHDRPDSSAEIIRSPESRTTLRPSSGIAPDASAGASRPVGTVAVSNSGYLRYEGELEISRVDVPGDERMNVAGRVVPEDLRLLPYIRDGFGFRLVR